MTRSEVASHASSHTRRHRSATDDLMLLTVIDRRSSLQEIMAPEQCFSPGLHRRKRCSSTPAGGPPRKLSGPRTMSPQGMRSMVWTIVQRLHHFPSFQVSVVSQGHTSVRASRICAHSEGCATALRFFSTSLMHSCCPDARLIVYSNHSTSSNGVTWWHAMTFR